MRIAYGLLAAAVLAAGPAMAADPGFYGGVGMGYSKINVNENKINNRLDGAFAGASLPWSVAKSDVDQNATPYMFTVGYRIMDYLAVEVAWLDMGTADYAGSITDGSVGVGKVRGSWDASGWPLSVLGIWPIDDMLEVWGRVGLFMGDVQLTARAFDGAGNPLARVKDSNSTNQFFGGVGVDANFYENWTARFEWQAMPSIGNDDTGSGNFNNLMLSILYRF